MQRKAVVINHHEAHIYDIAEGSEDYQVKPSKRHHFPHEHLKQKHSSYAGQRVPEDHVFFESVCGAVKDADEILLVSHGKGKSSAGLMLMKYIGKHHHDLLANIVGFESLNDMTPAQLAAHARHVFSDYEHRRALGFED
ncbi:MAG: hypothetical protein AAGA91_13145 [Pseudomonadota bacterium]